MTRVRARLTRLEVHDVPQALGLGLHPEAQEEVLDVLEREAEEESGRQLVLEELLLLLLVEVDDHRVVDDRQHQRQQRELDEEEVGQEQQVNEDVLVVQREVLERVRPDQRVQDFVDREEVRHRRRRVARDDQRDALEEDQRDQVDQEHELDRADDLAEGAQDLREQSQVRHRNQQEDAVQEGQQRHDVAAEDLQRLDPAQVRVVLDVRQVHVLVVWGSARRVTFEHLVVVRVLG